MKPKKITRKARTPLLLGSAATLMLATASILAAPAASADAALTLNYKCTYPLIGQQDLQVKVTANIPDKVALNAYTPDINIKAVSTVSGDTTFGLWTTLTKQLTGTARAHAKITAPQYPTGLPLQPAMTLDSATVPDSGPFDIVANGTQKGLTFTKAGWAQITVGNLDLTINALGADGKPSGLGTISAACKQLPNQNNVLAQFLIDDGSNPAKPEPKPDNYPAPNPVQTLSSDLPTSPEKTLDYTCPYPLVGDGDLQVKVKSNFPTEVPVNTATQDFISQAIQVTSVSTVPADVNENGLQQLGAVQMDGTALAHPTITVPEMANPVPLQMALKLDKTNVPPTGPVSINGPGKAPALSFTKTGSGKVVLDNIDIQNFTTYDADGNPANLGDFTCTLKPGQENTLFSFTVKDGGGTTTPPDITAPSVPANVKGTGSPDGSVALSWDASTDNDGGSGVKGYYVTVDGKKGDLVTGTSTSITGLSAGDHTFAVSAVDNAGNPSENSAAVTVNVPAPADVDPPTTPANLKGTGSEDGSVALSWDASSDGTDGSGVKGYYVTVDGKKGADLVTGTSTSVSGLSAGDHTFSVSAVDNAGNPSTDSAPVTVNVPAAQDKTAPSIPANVAGTGTDDSVALSWNASTDNDGGSGVKGYYVTVDGKKGADLVTGTSTTIPGLAKGDHTFAVSAVDNAGNESNASDAITVNVPGTQPTGDNEAPSVPANVQGTGKDDTASLTWDASTDNDGGSGVKGYYVTVDGKKGDLVAGTSTTIPGLAKGDHTFAVSAVDNAGNESKASAAITVNVPGTSTPPPGGSASFTLSGSTAIKGGNGKAALSGKVDATVDGGKVSADLTLNPTTGTFSLFGFIPATADIAFAPQGKTTGTLSGSTLSTDTKTVVKIPSIKVFGMNVGGGDTCQTSKPADIPLKSTNFNVATGGTLTGGYTLPSLTGCGFLTPFVSSFVAGAGNTIDLKATPAK